MMKKVLILSPHLDDAVLSCGDLISKYVKEGYLVDVLTIFSGSEDKENLSTAAKQFHSNCFLDHNAMLIRKEEDKKAHDFLGCNSLYLDKLECLYRRDNLGYLYPDLNNIYHLEYNREKENIKCLSNELQDIAKNYDIVYAPLGLGKHADHLMVNEAMKLIDGNYELYFYEEVAYVCYYYRSNKFSDWGKGMKNKLIEISDDEYDKKISAILLYRSQLRILWENRIQFESEMESFSKNYGNRRYMRVWYNENKK